MLGSKELKAKGDGPAFDRLSEYGKQQLDRVLVPLKLEGFSLHVTLAGDDFGCLAEIIAYIKALGIPCEIDPCNEDPALKPGSTYARYTARMRWLQGQLAGTPIGGLTGVLHGWNGDWLPAMNRNAETAEFGEELGRHLEQIKYVYAPGSELRAVNGWAKFTTNLYVSRVQPDLGVKLALITKARAVERLVHTKLNSNALVYSEFGVWLPEPSKAYSHAFSTGAAIREVRSWPGVHRVTIYAPWNDPFYSIGGTDQASVSRVNGYARGLGL